MPGLFEDVKHYRAISKEEAFAVLDKAEAAGLVHTTWNIQFGHYFICNCCGCCCANLEAINKSGVKPSDAVNSSYFCRIDADACTVCGVCKEERCQVNAIEAGDEAYTIVREKCIGCGLCVTTCPVQAISLVRKEDEEIAKPPVDEKDWYIRRAQLRGIDIGRYK